MEKILLIRLSSLGDIVLTTPAIRAIRSHYPNAYIAMLVAKQSADVLKHNPHLNEIIHFDRLSSNKDTVEMYRILRILRQRKFTLSIDFQRKFRTELLMYLSGATQRIGKGILSTKRVSETENKHATEHNFDLLHAAGIPAENRQLEIFLEDIERVKAHQLFNNAGINDADLTVGLFPGAGWKLREWMPDRFATIGDKLITDFNAKVLIFGGPNDVDLGNHITYTMKQKTYNFAGKLTLRELAACINQCKLFLSNDTGPMHIATAVGTPTVALFGPGNHIRFQPIGDIHTLIRYDVPCSPCKQFTNKCKDNICMKGITVDDVWDSIGKVFNSIL
ncbi:glycosyltransferase family 9 protein [Candidatus Poribacteria bacterium]|nr:glycosyltransferase family 9 protein [Candidatus Poribacteria bacterium]